MEIINNAAEKYKGFQNEICNPLFEMLREINALEKEAMEREEKIEEYKEENGIDESEYTPEEEELSDYFCEEMKKIVSPARCSPKLLKRGYGISWGDPPTYGYIDEVCEATFSMRNAERAAVEIRCTDDTIADQYKFVYRLIDGKWLMDEVYWRYGSDDNWEIAGIK